MSEYGKSRQVLPFASVLLQRNPGVMTLDGTNTWLIGSPDAPVIVDPGQRFTHGLDGASSDPGEALDDGHLDTLLAAAPHPSLVLLTHRHHDHVELAAQLHERTGVAVRAVDPRLCLDAEPLRDGESIADADTRIEVLTTPGHTSDSAAFVVNGDVEGGAVLTGDTILGRGTTVVAHPDGELRAYLASLARLRALGDLAVLPGHGPDLPSVAQVASFYLEHRAQRLDQVRAALHELGSEATARQVVEAVYADVDEHLWPAAELSVQAQLDYLLE